MLWSTNTDAPQLYGLRVNLRRGDVVLDSVGSYAGLRKIGVGQSNGSTRILFNDQPVFQVGVLDQGYWPDGLYTAPTDEALDADVVAIKQLGFNAVRKHVKIEPDTWYWHCDRHGLNVWQDMPSGGVPLTDADKQQFTDELLAMVDGRRNHPSIMTWIAYNADWGLYDKTTQLAQRVIDRDPSRLVDYTSGIPTPAGTVSDTHSYVDPDQATTILPDAARPAIIGEFGGIGLRNSDNHSWTTAMFDTSKEPAANSDALTARFAGMMKVLYQLRDTKGISGGIYTQLTDIETEDNGLYTYDRELKLPNRGRPGCDPRPMAASSSINMSSFPPPASLPHRLLESFMLRSVERRVAKRSVAQSEQARAYFQRASAQHIAAQAMFENDSIVEALEIAKASAVLYARARLAAAGNQAAASLSHVDVLTMFGARVGAGEEPNAPARLGDLSTLLARVPELRIADAQEPDTVAIVREVLDLLSWLQETSEVRSPDDIQHQRIRRIVAVCLSIVACLAWFGYRLGVAQNVALNRPVTVSSVHPLSTAVDGGLVDGLIVGAPYGVHTNVEEMPWVTVDLQSVRTLKTVKIYNRGDGWLDESLPLVLELSLDNQIFTKVDTRTTPFRQTMPWVASIGRQKGRYIRVRGKPKGWVALSELEVYER